MEFLSILTTLSTNGGETNRPFASIIFFAPEMGGYFLEANNFVPADPLVTPDILLLYGTLLLSILF